jgi:FkbM family methyltransferase
VGDPFLSVIMPVYNGARFLERAVASARRQGYALWELIAVDDGSTDASLAVLRRLAAEDPRLRVLQLSSNGGVSAARNAGLREARGEWVAYLDCDDEFYPDHFARVFDSRELGDVLVFAYDLLEERPGLPGAGRAVAWDPRAAADRLMYQHVAVPLGVAHRRELLARAGAFDESLRRDEDSDLWRRFAQAGAAFRFLPHKSGLYHVRADSLSRTTAPAAAQMVHVELSQGEERYLFRAPQREAEVVRDVLERHEYGGVPHRLLRRPPTMLDVGANVGAFAVFARLHYHKAAVVHCFEPFPPSVELLRQNTGPFPGVQVHPFALGDRDGEAPLYVHGELSVCNSLVPGLVASPASEARVKVRDAGAVWDELGLTEVDVLKLDAEGSEVAILESLGRRLGSIRFVLAEFHSRRDRRHIDALLGGFELFGAKFYSVDVGVVKYARADLVRA